MIKLAKTRGRPRGSTNKPKEPKRYELSRTQIQIAEKLGIPKEKYIETLIKEKMIKPVKTDWQKLAKRLQEALESQIKDYQELEEYVFKLEKDADEHDESHRRYITVISYLETKLGLNPV
jgi:DNA-directed RNA polymerase specialized sigma subunit